MSSGERALVSFAPGNRSATLEYPSRSIPPESKHEIWILATSHRGDFAKHGFTGTSEVVDEYADTNDDILINHAHRDPRWCRRARRHDWRHRYRKEQMNVLRRLVCYLIVHIPPCMV
ncbi:hypothetical protein M405DRAFT_833770 [Rhizopogon salebrosus TDB-379]|nr:hypothetical protein M405DRAFT_833770 [Rhizopogon salebrosus TDB-379]